MIKKFLFLMLIVCFSYSVKSQFIHSIDYKAGISVSALNYNVTSNSPIITPSNFKMFEYNYTAYTTVFGINYFNHKYWNLETQLGYIQTGGIGHLIFTDIIGTQVGNSDYAYTLDYTYFNTLLKIKYPIGRFIPYIKLGPHLDYLLSATYYDDSYKRFNYGLALGSGVDFDLNKHVNISAEFNYNWFAAKILDSSVKISIAKNESLLLGIAYKF